MQRNMDEQCRISPSIRVRSRCVWGVTRGVGFLRTRLIELRTDGHSDSSFVSVSPQFVSQSIERIQKMRVIIERVLKMGSGAISSFDAAFS
jgi:hypothetical protein